MLSKVFLISLSNITHWKVVKRIFQYWNKGEVGKRLIGYADADGSMSEDWHALSGYTFLNNDGAVSWSTK